MIAPLVCGLVGNTGHPEDFKWGFLASSIGMMIAATVFQLFKSKYIIAPDGTPIGMPPKPQPKETTATPDTAKNNTRTALMVGCIVALTLLFSYNWSGEGGIFAGADWFGSFIYATTIVMPILGKRGIEPSSPRKQSIGLLLLSLGYLFIAFGVKNVEPGVKVSMIWLTGLYFIHTMGELCLAPIGLSLVFKLSPARFSSLLMGVWYLSTASANKFAGLLSGYYPEAGVAKSFMGFAIENLFDFFMIFVFMSGAAAIILFFLSSKLQKMMQIED